jgi:hypothetical protein
MFAIIVPLIVVILMFFVLQSTPLAAALPVGCTDDGILYNSFTHAESFAENGGQAIPNRLQGETPFTRCYGVNACYAKSLANQTCIRHWCYLSCYNQYISSSSSPQIAARVISSCAQSCMQNPTPLVKQNCKNLSPLNPATLFSCYESTALANNATMIESCDASVLYCVPGDAPFCPQCKSI